MIASALRIKSRKNSKGEVLPTDVEPEHWTRSAVSERALVPLQNWKSPEVQMSHILKEYRILPLMMAVLFLSKDHLKHLKTATKSPV